MFLVTVLLLDVLRRAEFKSVTICDAVSLNARPALVTPTGLVDRSSRVPTPNQTSSACMCLLSADCVRKRPRAASVKLCVSQTARKSSNHLRFIGPPLGGETPPEPPPR